MKQSSRFFADGFILIILSETSLLIKLFKSGKSKGCRISYLNPLISIK
jgi:hypothetical protein